MKTVIATLFVLFAVSCYYNASHAGGADGSAVGHPRNNSHPQSHPVPKLACCSTDGGAVGHPKNN